MAFTGKLGTSDSKPGNIRLGSATSGGPASYTADVSETVSVVEQLVGLATTSLLASEDSLAGAMSPGGPHTQEALSVTPTETISVVESPFVEAPTGLLGDDDSSLSNMTLAGSPTGQASQQDYSEGVNETVTVTEARTATAAHVVGVTESVSLSEAIAGSKALSTGVNETVTVSEATSRVLGANAAANETVTVSDTSAFQSAKVLGAAETVTVSDATTRQSAGNVPVVENLSMSDHVALNRGYTVGVNETASVSDGVAARQGFQRSVSDSVGMSEAMGLTQAKSVGVNETASLTESRTTLRATVANVSESISVTDMFSTVSEDVFETVGLLDAVASNIGYRRGVSETIPSTASVQAVLVSGYHIGVEFSEPMSRDGVADPTRYRVTSLGAGVSAAVEQVVPVSGLVATGMAATLDDTTLLTYTMTLDGASLTSASVGQYITITGPASSWNVGQTVKIVEVLDPTTVLVDLPLLSGDPQNGSIEWRHETAVLRVLLRTNKITNGQQYLIEVDGTKTVNGQSYQQSFIHIGSASKPRIDNVSFLENGAVLVTFAEPMRIDDGYTDVADYSITGPTTPVIHSVIPVSDRVVRLSTTGLEQGSYTLSINPFGTPKDVAGNPIDPTFSTAAFTAGAPINTRSVFTDKGPIAKPPLTLQSGSTASVASLTEVTCPTGAFTPSHVGLYLTLGGSANGGTYRISGVVSATKLRLQASFTLPDPSDGSLTWTLFDPRDGEIADDPSDVTVRINGTPVTPDAVIGLLGQVVLPSMPLATDDVKIDYSWVRNPTVEIRRLNSREFVLNAWNRDSRTSNPSQHAYRFNSVLTKPSSYNPLDISAALPSPELRDLYYRAYERAYTASLNDPTTLVLNTPTHRIAYPPLARTVPTTNVSYPADVLPEVDPIAPWDRLGSGTASIVAGNLVIDDNTTGPFPTGNPLFWTRSIDTTFPHVFAATWRNQIDLVTTPEGVWTGVAVGWSNENRTLVVGYLIDGGVKKIGFLKRGAGNDPSLIASWGGGFDGLGNPTGAPVAFDWSVLHSYRLYRDRDGTIRLYVDGEVIESLRVQETALPFLEELNDPFRNLQGVFFGSLSRPARQTSTWDFMRYLVLPTNPEQSAPSRFTTYEADVVPEDHPEPWTPIGYHGTETILAADTLLLDSTSATTEATEASVGLMGGDFRGFMRLEPLLAVSSDVVLDINTQLRTFTHGFSPNALMAAIDDGNRLTQLSFLSGAASPKASYPGRSLPGDATPKPWSALGTATVEMLGRTLRISDTTTTDGRVYFIDDAPLISEPDRIMTPTTNYMLEFRCAVVSTTPDAAGFAGVTADVFDGSSAVSGRALGVMLREVAGIKYVSLHSDGTVIQQWAFNWGDGKPHTYRLVKTQASPNPVVSLFVDGVLVGSADYTLFTSAIGPGTISFGSSTATSNLARSVVDWYYCNAWRVQPTTTAKYVGIWKGVDGDSLIGYHLPTKVPTSDASVAGNVLTDPAGNFLARGVVAGNKLVIDVGPNKGVYDVAAVPTATTLTIAGTFPVQPTGVRYRIPTETDWSAVHRFRIVRDPGGSVAVFIDAEDTPIIQVEYNNLNLPSSVVGLPYQLNGTLPSVSFGAFDPTNLSQSAWDYVRYGITRSPSELRIVPHHEVLNQRNVMASPEHLFTTIPHDHTDFWSSSTGIPDRSLYDDPALPAFTKLNEGTPLMPSTQTWEVRKPTPVFEPISGLNRPEDVLNGDRDFLLNDGRTRVRLLVPKDVLYTSLQVIERTDGEEDLIAPMHDNDGPSVMDKLNFTKEVCLHYDGTTLPELTASPTPWILESDNPSEVSATTMAGVLTYSTGSTGTRTIYRNATPLPDAISLQTEVKFRLKLLADASLGTGDTGVRFGFFAFGLSCALAWITDGFGNRFVEFLDINSGTKLGQVPFDFDDGSFHTYRFVKSPGAGLIHFYIDG